MLNQNNCVIYILKADQIISTLGGTRNLNDCSLKNYYLIFAYPDRKYSSSRLLLVSYPAFPESIPDILRRYLLKNWFNDFVISLKTI